jgi:glycosyltransferase involved in cell wall biosynthesis
MRLLYLSADPGVPVLGHKGASVHVRALVAAFAATGVDVVVASPRVAFEGERLEARARLVEIGAVLPKTFADARSLRDAVDRQADDLLALASDLAVDAVYERLALFSAAGVRAAAALGIPHVLEVNAPLRAEAARFRSLPHPEAAAALECEVLERTDRVFAVSTTLADLLVAAGVDAAKIEAVPNGVSTEAIRSIVPRRGSRFTVGFAGSLKPWHGIDVLLAGFATALRHEPTLRLEIVGSGPLADAVTASGLPAGALEYRGQLTHHETLQAVAGWDVGAAPYPRFDDFYFSPLKVGEYMACGACPVTSDLPVLRALLGGGARGVLVEPGNAIAFAAAIVALARDRARARALGDHARKHALASLGWHRNAQSALAALAPLAGASR